MSSEREPARARLAYEVINNVDDVLAMLARRARGNRSCRNPRMTPRIFHGRAFRFLVCSWSDPGSFGRVERSECRSINVLTGIREPFTRVGSQVQSLSRPPANPTENIMKCWLSAVLFGPRLTVQCRNETGKVVHNSCSWLQNSCSVFAGCSPTLGRNAALAQNRLGCPLPRRAARPANLPAPGDSAPTRRPRARRLANDHLPRAAPRL